MRRYNTKLEVISTCSLNLAHGFNAKLRKVNFQQTCPTFVRTINGFTIGTGTCSCTVVKALGYWLEGYEFFCQLLFVILKVVFGFFSFFTCIHLKLCFN